MKKDDKTLRAESELRTELDRLVKDYGLEAVRRVCNRYLKAERLKAAAKKEIAKLEDQLERLRRVR